MDHASVEQLRSFNRTVMTSMGALDDRFLGRSRPLGAARLLWEAGQGELDVRTLRERLDLDSGYASRLLRSLERDGLVEVVPDPADRRVRRVRLTPAGRRERAELDRRADVVARRVLDGLHDQERDRLVRSMADVERLLLRASITVSEVPARSPDARRTFARYVTELAERLPNGFDADAALRADVAPLLPPSGAVLVAYRGSEPLGCGAIRFLEDGSGLLKRVWVAPELRGLGLGRRLVEELEVRARARGCVRMRLQTHHVLTEALAMYERAGYAVVPPFDTEPYADRWLEKAW